MSMALPPNLDAELRRWGPWRSMLASSAPEVFGAMGALAAVTFGLTQLLNPSIHEARLPEIVYVVPPEGWGIAFLINGLWLFSMCFTGKRDDMESPAVLLSIVWALFAVLMVIPDERVATPGFVTLMILATTETALVSLMAGGDSHGVRTKLG